MGKFKLSVFYGGFYFSFTLFNEFLVLLPFEQI